MSNLEMLHAAFIGALGLAPGETVTTLAYRTHKKWDSVAHMQLVAALERTFNIMLDTDEVIGMSSYTAATELLKKRGITL